MLKGDDTMKKYIAMKVVEAELMDSEAASKYLGRIVAPKSTGTTHNAEYGSHPGYLVKYYDGFYDIVNDPKQLERKIYNNCEINHNHLHRVKKNK